MNMINWNCSKYASYAMESNSLNMINWNRSKYASYAMELISLLAIQIVPFEHLSLDFSLVF